MQSKSIDLSNPDTYDTSGDRVEVQKYLDNAVKTMAILAAFETATTPVLFLTPLNGQSLNRNGLDYRGTMKTSLAHGLLTLKYADDLKAGAYQTKTFADHILYPAISGFGQGALRVAGVKALEKKAADALTTFLSKNEASALRKMIVSGVALGIQSIAGLANVVYQLSVFLAGFLTVYRTFIDVPTAKTCF